MSNQTFMARMRSCAIGRKVRRLEHDHFYSNGRTPGGNTYHASFSGRPSAKQLEALQTMCDLAFHYKKAKQNR